KGRLLGRARSVLEAEGDGVFYHGSIFLRVLFFPELLPSGDGFFDEDLAALGADTGTLNDGTVAPVACRAFAREVAARTGELGDKTLYARAAGLHLYAVVRVKFKVIGRNGHIAEAQNVQFHFIGFLGARLLRLVTILHALIPTQIPFLGGFVLIFHRLFGCRLAFFRGHYSLGKGERFYGVAESNL